MAQCSLVKGLCNKGLCLPAVCKYLAVELQGRLEETGKVKDYIVTGHGIMPGDIKRKDYHRS